MKRLTKTASVIVLSLAILASAGCSSTTKTPAATASGDKTAAAPASKFPEKPIEFIAPSGAGGGWDTTARVAAKVLNEQKIVTQPITVQNKEGGGGAVGLAYLKSKKGTAYTVNVYSPPLLLNNLNGSTPDSYKDTTPLAMVMTDYDVLAVAANSPYKTLGDLFAQAKKDPKSIKLGGGSAPGSMDHIAYIKAAKAAGVDVKLVPYVSFQGGGEAMTALLGNHVDVITTGISETLEQARAGKIRLLAVLAPNRLDIIKDVPTAKEQGVNADFAIWRGFFGPPGMPEDAKKYFESAFDQMLKSDAWKAEAAKQGWNTVYKNSADFTQFLDQQNTEMAALLTDLGLKK
ncbi:MAG: tripartite tricarboxylate transporter substrate binding protein [Mycobacterium leprae]